MNMNPRVFQLLMDQMTRPGVASGMGNIANMFSPLSPRAQDLADHGPMQRIEPMPMHDFQPMQPMNPRVQAMQDSMPMEAADPMGMDPEMEAMMRQEAMRKQKEKMMYAPQSLR